MNRFDELKLDIYDAWASGLITESEKDMLFLEMKTRTEYSVEKFKSKYKYNDSKEEVEKYGYPTITVDGKKYCAYIKNSNKDEEIPIYQISSVDGEGYDGRRPDPVRKELSAIMKTKDGLIVIPPDFFELKTQGRRDAAIKHEVGHLELHDDIKNKRVSPNSASTKFRDSMAKAEFEKNKKLGVYKTGATKEEQDKIDTAVMNAEKRAIASDKDIKTKQKSADMDMVNSRERAIDSALKYGNIPGRHKNLKEYEADRYSANRTSEKDLRKSLTEMQKLDRKNRKKILDKKLKEIQSDPDLSNEEKKKEKERLMKGYHDANKKNEEDTKARFNAIRDEVLRKEKFYKKKGNE